MELWVIFSLFFWFLFFRPTFYSTHVFIMQWVSLWRQKTIEAVSLLPSKMFRLAQFSAGITLVFALFAGPLPGVLTRRVNIWLSTLRFSLQLIFPSPHLNPSAASLKFHTLHENCLNLMNLVYVLSFCWITAVEYVLVNCLQCGSFLFLEMLWTSCPFLLTLQLLAIVDGCLNLSSLCLRM